MKMNNEANKYECKIYALIEYQNKIEKVWRRETNEDLYHEQIDLLKKKIQ